MAYIYKITNKINGKLYIGATTLSLEERFKHHFYDSRRKRCAKRALYKAINKYGIENFIIEVLEEVEEDIRFEKEIEWIEKLETFKEGYNETYGGCGKSLIDYSTVIKTYEKVKNISEVSRILGHDTGQISEILNENNVDILSSTDVIQSKVGKRVGKFDLGGTLLGVYSSTSEAEKQNQGTIRYKIADVCRGDRKTHKGFKWEYL